MDNFEEQFRSLLEEEDITYDVKGFITSNKDVYPLGTDTKVLSSVFELMVRPVIYNLADKYDKEVKEARAQNYYPDFTIMENEDDESKYAVDVKTTYKEKESHTAKFTLGSYTSFMREGNETKNIEFPYPKYSEHWIVGFVYIRESPDKDQANIFSLDDLNQIPTPFSDVRHFVSPKWKIAGDKAGSGNTANIGSIRGNIEDFRDENGVFNSESEFLEYWRNYERTASEREDKYSDIEEFREWNSNQ
jgi:hypothetical protein